MSGIDCNTARNNRDPNTLPNKRILIKGIKSIQLGLMQSPHLKPFSKRVRCTEASRQDIELKTDSLAETILEPSGSHLHRVRLQPIRIEVTQMR
jgi:hypothetical protein